MLQSNADSFSSSLPFNTSMRRAVTFFGEASLTSYLDGAELFASVWSTDAKFDLDEYVSLTPFLALHLEHPVTLRCKSPDRTWQAKSYPGDFCLTPRDMSHTFSWDDKATILIMFLAPDLVDSFASEFTKIDPARIAICQQFTFQDAWLQETSKLIYAEIQAGLPYGQTYLESLSQSMTAHILRYYSNINQQVLTPRETFGKLTALQLRRVDEYIREHLAQDKALLVDKLAALVNLPAGRFYRYFREATGMRPHEYIIQTRLEEARKFLAHNDHNLSLAALANQLGFADQAHMTRLFKRHFGVTPSKYDGIPYARIPNRKSRRNIQNST